MNEESLEIIHNARAAQCDGQITQEQKLDVYKLVADWEAEKELEERITQWN